MTIKAIERINYRLNDLINEALADRTKIADEMTKGNGAAEYRLRWLDGAYTTIMLGWIAEEIKEKIAAGSEATVVADYLDHYRRELARWYPESSTSRSSNACNLEKYDAFKKIIEHLERFEEYLKTE